MLKNYLKLAIRQLQKQKFFAAINVFGLSAGIACFVLLLLFVGNEFGFDRFHGNARDIYRLYTVWTNSETGEKDPTASTEYTDLAQKPAGPALKKFFPEIEDYTQVQLAWGENLLRTGNKTIRAELSFAEPSFFSIFDFPLLEGTKRGVLHGPADLVITESRAVQLFGSAQKAMGQPIDIQLGTKYYPFTVSGVVSDLPGNSSIRYDIIGTYAFTAAHRPDDFVIGNNWHPTVRQTYVRLRPGSRLAADARQLNRFLLNFTPPSAWKEMGYSDWKKPEPPFTLKMQPLLTIHTDTKFHGWGFTDFERIDPQTIWILLGIASGILLIACINFTTLAIARSASRSKEVGVRKVIGAGRRQIIIQFLSEAMLLSAVSALLGLLIAKAVLPWFNQLAGRELHFSLLQYPQLFLVLTVIVLIAGILAGSYPALVLARFRPVEVLKNKIRVGGSNMFTRGLVTFQFALSIALIGGTIVILQQTKYLLNKDPGFDKENVVAIDASQTDPDKIFDVFRQDLLDHPEVLGVTSAGAGMGKGKGLLGYSDKRIKADVNIVDTSYMKVIGMHLLVGENVRPGRLNDSIRPVVINETFMHAMGWSLTNVVGKQINPFQGNIAVVRGVVKNFNYEPMGQSIFNQLFMCTGERGYVNFYVRLRPGNPSRALGLIQNAWHDAAPGVPLKYSFLDADINAFYQGEQTWASIVASAGAMSIFLSCLGLLGLASLAAVNRRKEVGIRKVLGASVRELVVLLSGEFVRLVAIAFLIAAPLTWLIMRHWLEGYAVRIELHFSVLLAAGIAAVVTAILAVGLQAIRAANANPVSSLRSE
jgi:putative ABC transport system permease protein